MTDKPPTIDEMEFALNHPELGLDPSIDPDGTARMTQLTPEQIEEKAKGLPVIVYVSASSSERGRARWALDCVKDAPDMVLAHDWLTEIEDKHGGSANRGLGFDVSSKIAWDTIARVARSALLWLLIPETATMGAGVELGAFAMAMSAGLASPRRIVASGPGPDISVFTGLADTYFEHDADALKHLYETARELRERERVVKRVPTSELSEAAQAAEALGVPPGPLHRAGDPECLCRMCLPFPVPEV